VLGTVGRAVIVLRDPGHKACLYIHQFRSVVIPFQSKSRIIERS
jgi:hypothetical protein